MTARDKRMFGTLIVVVILALGYLFVYRPIITKTEAMRVEIETYTVELDALNEHYNRIDEYKAVIESSDEEIAMIREDLPSDLTQERAFRLVFDIEDEFEHIDFDDLSFSDLQVLNASNDQDDETTLESIRRVVSSDISVPYEEVKSFLRYIGNYENRTVLTNLSMLLNEEDGTIGSTVVLNMYGMRGDNLEILPVEFEAVDYGKPQPFNSPSIDWSGINEVDVEYPSDYQDDLFLSLKPIESDGYTHVVGKVIDVGESSYVRKESNEKLQGIIRIYNEGDTFYANYDIDGDYAERQEFNVETALELTIFSSTRTGDDDLVGMNLTVYNQTDLKLFVDILNDDTVNSRIDLSVAEGEVIVK